MTPRNADVLNITEAAAFLGAHEQTVRRMARRGAIPCFKVGKDWRFRRDALLRWTDEWQLGGGQCSVLIIDDEEKICKALTKVVEQLGCRVRQATSGAKGLALVAQEVPDLILLDLLMPDMNGPQFLKELRATSPGIPVTIVTGYPEGDLMAEAMQYGPLGLLAKPVDATQLENMLASTLGRRWTVNAPTEARTSLP
jgi:excisionase family DNA binding protein